MDRKTFNPLDWADFEVPGGLVNGGEGYSSDIASDVESVLRNIEEKKVDITTQYAHWRNIGFGLAAVMSVYVNFFKRKKVLKNQ